MPLWPQVSVSFPSLNLHISPLSGFVQVRVLVYKMFFFSLYFAEINQRSAYDSRMLRCPNELQRISTFCLYRNANTARADLSFVQIFFPLICSSSNNFRLKFNASALFTCLINLEFCSTCWLEIICLKDKSTRHSQMFFLELVYFCNL